MPVAWTRITRGSLRIRFVVRASDLIALKSHELLNDSARWSGYGELQRGRRRSRPPAHGRWRASGRSFLNGFAHPAAGPGRHVSREDRRVRGPGGDFGLASGRQPDGGYGRTWFGEPVPAEEIAFDSGVFLFRKDRAAAPDIIR